MSDGVVILAPNMKVVLERMLALAPSSELLVRPDIRDLLLERINPGRLFLERLARRAAAEMFDYSQQRAAARERRARQEMDRPW